MHRPILVMFFGLACLALAACGTDEVVQGSGQTDAAAAGDAALDSEAVNLSIPASEFVVFSLGPKTA